MIRSEEIVCVGRITRLHGRKGEVQCVLENGVLYDADFEFVVLRIEGLFVPFRVTEWRGKGADSVLFSLQGVCSEQSALRLVGAEVYLLRKDCAAADGSEESALVWQDLTGYRLLDADGEDMGWIVSVDETTANTLCRTDKDRLFPLHEDLILRLDTGGKEIELDYRDAEA